MSPTEISTYEQQKSNSKARQQFRVRAITPISSQNSSVGHFIAPTSEAPSKNPGALLKKQQSPKRGANRQSSVTGGSSNGASCSSGVSKGKRVKDPKGPQANRQDAPQQKGGISNGQQQPSQAILDEFKSLNKTKTEWDLSQIKGHILLFSQDQQGSRFIQEKLDSGRDSEKAMIFEEIIKESQSLIVERYGNYVIQKFLVHGSREQIDALVENLRGEVYTLSVHAYGCRVIQKALEVISREKRLEMANELRGQVLDCVRDHYGNHVIQKCIEMAKWKGEDSDYEDMKFILAVFEEDTQALAKHSHGCRVLQRMIEFCTEQQLCAILKKIETNSIELMKDKFGNYVIQQMLENGPENARDRITKIMKSRLLELSQDKFASNVVETCFKFANKHEQYQLVNMVISRTEADG
jgi:pumilio RNA-binding family